MPLNFNFNQNPSEQEVQSVKDSLKEYNDRIAGDDNFTPLNIAVYDDRGAIIAGIVGGTYWGWLNIDRLWVHEDYRRSGVGKSLVEQAETEAVARGCKYAHVDTMDFQAPGFYQKLGYEIKGEFKDLPEGHSRIFMTKKIEQSS